MKKKTKIITIVSSAVALVLAFFLSMLPTNQKRLLEREVFFYNGMHSIIY